MHRSGPRWPRRGCPASRGLADWPPSPDGSPARRGRRRRTFRFLRRRHRKLGSAGHPLTRIHLVTPITLERRYGLKRSGILNLYWSKTFWNVAPVVDGARWSPGARSRSWMFDPEAVRYASRSAVSASVRIV